MSKFGVRDPRFANFFLQFFCALAHRAARTRCLLLTTLQYTQVYCVSCKTDNGQWTETYTNNIMLLATERKLVCRRGD